MAFEEYYKEMYKKHFLPPLGRVMNSSMSIGERGRAIKYLADESLALTASGEDWSRALVQTLLQQQQDPAAAPSALASPQAKPSADSLKLRRIAARTVFSRQFDRVRASSSPGRRLSTAAVMRRARRFKQVGGGPSRKSRITNSGRPRAIRSRVRELQSLVPGGTQMNCKVLLDQAADYMMFLKLQVGVLQSLLGQDEAQQYQHQHQQHQQKHHSLEA